MTFENLSLHPKILKAIAEADYSEPTKIQMEAIPQVLSGFDLRASAQTGTGKTAAFLLPILHQLASAPSKSSKRPRALILVPTRELGMQIAVQAEKYSKHLHQIKTVCIGGGVPYHSQLRKLSRPYDILIATPGRLIDFMNQRKIDLSGVELLVLDEADRMLDMGFIDPVEQIIAATPTSRQTLLFSATLKGNVIRLSQQHLKNPVEIIIHPDRANHEGIEQRLHYVDDLYHKNRLLDHILDQDGVNSALIFTSTKRHADQLVGELQDKGRQSGALHGDMSQRQRNRTIAQLRSGKINILVATDVAARGIDIQSITHVINFDLPHSVEDYVHRIGRTGRAGAKGIALSFVAGRDAALMKQIEKFMGQQVNIVEVAGLEPRPKQHRSKQRHSKKQRPKQRSYSPNRSSRQFRPKAKPGRKRAFRP